MSEREIREILREVCADLDRHSRAVVRNGVRKIVLPTVLGAGLALGGCDSASRPMYAAPLPDGQVADSQVSDGVAPTDGAVYAAPDVGPTPPYMAPDSSPVYAAPDMVYMAPDAGPTPPYMAPDKGPQPDYMAPDGAPVPPYMAPDAGK